MIRYKDVACIDCGTVFTRKLMACSQKRCPECQHKHHLAKRRAMEKTPERRAKNAANKRKRYAANPEPFRQITREWRAKNKDHILQYNHDYEREHRQKLNEWRREYYAKNSNAVKAMTRRYRENNHDRVMEKQRLYRQKNRERLNLIQRLKRRFLKGDTSVVMRLAEARGKKIYCERLHLKAFPLPCGNYPSCNHCQHCPKGGVKRIAWGRY